MRALLLAIASLFLLTSVAQAVEVSNEYELNKPFDLVSSMLALPSSDKRIVERSGAELVKREVREIGVVFTPKGGWQLVLVWHRVVVRNGEEMQFTEVVTRKKGEVLIITELVSEHSEIKGYVLHTHIKANGTKTTIRNELSLDVGRDGFLVRAITRAKLIQMEKAVREIVHDPLPEKPEEE